MHWGTVKDIEKKYLKTKFRKIRLKDVKVIGIDELHTGDGFITIVGDLDSGAVLHVGVDDAGQVCQVRRLRRPAGSLL